MTGGTTATTTTTGGSATGSSTVPIMDAATAASLEEIEQEILRMQQKIKQKQQQQQQQQQSPSSAAVSSISPSIIMSSSPSVTIPVPIPPSTITPTSVSNTNTSRSGSRQPTTAAAVAVTTTTTTTTNGQSSNVTALSEAALELRREIEAMEAEILRAGVGPTIPSRSSNNNNNNSNTRKGRQSNRVSSAIPSTSTSTSTAGTATQQRRQQQQQQQQQQQRSSALYNTNTNNSTSVCDTASTASGSSNTTPLTSNNNASFRSTFGGAGQTLMIPQSISTVDEYDDMISTHHQDQSESYDDGIKSQQQQQQQQQKLPQKYRQQQQQQKQSALRYPASLASSRSFDDERSQIEEEIRRMEEEIGRIGVTTTPPTPVTPSPPNNVTNSSNRPMFLQAIQSSATNREQRIHDNNGQLHITNDDDNIVPKKAPQLSIAEMVSQRAKDRDERLAAGGDKKMTKTKPKDEYKKEFTNVAMDAANLGRLTRLNEHTIETVAIEKAAIQEWKSGGLLSISWQQPTHMSVIQEAAQLGAMTKKQEKVISNYYGDNDNNTNNDYDITHDELNTAYDEYYDSTNNNAAHYDKLLQLDAQAGTGFEKVDTLLMGLKEESYPNAGDNRLLVRPMQCYQVQSVEEVQLPKPYPPRIDPARNKEKLIQQQKQMMHLLGESSSHYRPMTDIGHTVAEIAWERRTRLDRPGSLPRVQERCPCQYCINPSPYQTFAYKLLEQRLVSTGEWDRMKHPLRMDDPRVTQMAQAAQIRYCTPSDLPTNPSYDDDNNNNNNIDNDSYTDRPFDEESLQQTKKGKQQDDYNQGRFYKDDDEIDEQQVQQQQPPTQPVVTYQYLEEEEQQQPPPPQPVQEPKIQKQQVQPNNVPVPQPHDAGCCACVIL